MRPLMIGGDLCGSILRDRLGKNWLVATQVIQLRGKGDMEEPNKGSHFAAPKQNFGRNILRILPVGLEFSYSIADRHPT